MIESVEMSDHPEEYLRCLPRSLEWTRFWKLIGATCMRR